MAVCTTSSSTTSTRTPTTPAVWKHSTLMKSRMPMPVLLTPHLREVSTHYFWGCMRNHYCSLYCLGYLSSSIWTAFRVSGSAISNRLHANNVKVEPTCTRWAEWYIAIILYWLLLLLAQLLEETHHLKCVLFYFNQVLLDSIVLELTEWTTQDMKTPLPPLQLCSSRPD